jgi:hypothetical protein
MRLFSMSLLTGLSVLISCFLWIGGASWLLVKIFGLSADTGWTVAGILSALAMAAVGVFAYEVRHAIELPDDFDVKSVGNLSGVNPRLKFRSVAPMAVNPAPSFRSMGDRF